MRIRYLLLGAYGRGGTIRTTLSMAGALAERGHDVEVASLVQGRAQPLFPVPPGVRLVSLTGIRPRAHRPGTPGNALRWGTKVALRRTHSRLAHPRDLRCAGLTRAHDLALTRYVRAQDDCVVIATRISLNLALATLRTDGQVAIGQEHNFLTKQAGLRADYADRFPSLDAVAVLTESDAVRYRALLGTTCRVEVVPNALPHGIRVRRSPLTATVAVSAGSLIKRKGFDLLVDAWRPVAAAHPEWRLRIFGAGEEAAELTTRIEAAGLTGTVTLEGFEADLGARLDEASLFVLPSRREGMPMVLLEAMAAGLPVVAFDCPTGPAEVLDGGRSGRLVPNGDTAALSDNLLQVVSDEQERRRLADAAAARIRDFDVAVTAAHWESLFAELADRRGLSIGR